MTIKLTDTQKLLLSAAAEREDRCLVMPTTLKGGAARKVVAKLIDAAFAKEIVAKLAMPVWRREDETGRSYALRATAAGAKAVGGEKAAVRDEPTPSSTSRLEVAETRSEEEDENVRAKTPIVATSPSAPRVGTKIAQVVVFLNRDSGATLEELVAATGWLPHTTRAALTGLRKRGYVVSIDRSDEKRGSTYRIEKSRAPEREELRAQEREEAPPALTGRSKTGKRNTAAQTRQAA